MQSLAIKLSWFTILYNLIEGVVSIYLGISDEAIALAGFGGDSLIEVASASLVLWRFRGESGLNKSLSISKERKATFYIGFLFLVLSLLTILGASHQLITQQPPETTIPGIVISLISLSFMYFLWRAKLRVAFSLNSATVAKDAACSLACIKLSAILLIGSLIYFVIPAIWWVDSVAALIISGYIAKEGVETIAATRNSNFQGGCGCV